MGSEEGLGNDVFDRSMAVISFATCAPNTLVAAQISGSEFIGPCFGGPFSRGF